MKTMIKLNKDIVTSLVKMRKESGVLSKDVAKHIGKSTAYITKLEKGDIKSTDVYTIKGYIDITHQSDIAIEDVLKEYIPIEKARANKEFSDKIDAIIEAIGTILNGDSGYTLKRMDALVKNFQIDKCFVFAFMTLNLSGLKHLSYIDKENFLKEINDVIEKYSCMSPTIDFFTDI